MDNPAISKKIGKQVLGLVQNLSRNRLDLFFGGIAGLLLVALCLYMVWIWKTAHPSVPFAPGDVVYGQVVHAQHEMNPLSFPTSSLAPGSRNPLSPQIQISERFFDFGEVRSNQVVTRTFVIANRGSAPLVIQKAYTTCGCTTADFTAAVVPPGKVVLMRLRFDTGYHEMQPGSTVRRGVIFETNDPGNSQEEIWVQATIP